MLGCHRQEGGRNKEVQFLEKQRFLLLFVFFSLLVSAFFRDESFSIFFASFSNVPCGKQTLKRSL